MTDFIRPLKTVPLKSLCAHEMPSQIYNPVISGEISPGDLTLRLVICPNCRGQSVYHWTNPARPFCSPKCKAMDLGAWANEDFRVADTGVTGIEDLGNTEL
jgi:endogenous inhibitor of DNA gyrase (YacG/DUF329 family)